jgi:protein-S-isoprenylcysteine O-methyltransferase Ste14
LNRDDLNRPERQQGQNGLALKLPPGALVLIVAALMWIASSVTPALDFYLPAKSLLTMSLVLIGAIIALSGVITFRRAKTTVNPMKPDSTSSLTVTGPYHYTRNPMYLGFVFILLGWAAFLSNLATLAFLPAFIAYLNRFQIVPEERVLASLFPNEYQAYRAKVRRWI